MYHEPLLSLSLSPLPQSPSLLPFFLHLLSLSPSPTVTLSLLHLTPSLATHPLAAQAIVNYILALEKSHSLVAMAIRLLGRVWQRQDAVFPTLLSLLLHPVPPSAPVGVAMGVELAKAAVIRDICCIRY